MPLLGDWLESLPRQLAGNDVRRVRDHVCRVYDNHGTLAAAIGGHVIKTGCGPYLVDWIQRGILKAVALNGAAAIHDFELAVAGKTSEDVSATLHTGRFGMARETADAFALAARAGPDKNAGLVPHSASIWKTSAVLTPTTALFWPPTVPASPAPFTSRWAPTLFTCIPTYPVLPWVKHP